MKVSMPHQGHMSGARTHVESAAILAHEATTCFAFYLVYIFLAVIGAYCEISAVFELQEVGLVLLWFASLVVIIHGLVMILLGGLSFRDWEMVAIASQANIGGGTTAIALAESFNRKELILPGILVGTLGNAVGTYLGFLMVSIV